MRRLLSILLLAVLGLPAVTPLLAFGAGADAGVPACCRRNGAHHCQMGMGEQTSTFTHSAHWTILPGKCPFCPGTLTATHGDSSLLPAAGVIAMDVTAHPCGLVQTESRWRIARDRTRQKRGPPTLLG